MLKSHQYKTGRRVMNWRVGVLTLTIIYCAVMGYHSNDDLTYVREPDEMAVFMTATVVDHPEDIDQAQKRCVAEMSQLKQRYESTFQSLIRQ